MEGSSSYKRAHRKDHAHAEVVGVLLLALTSVPRERAALLGKEAAIPHGLSIGGWKADDRRRCVLEVTQESAREPHRKERRRHSALEPISYEVPAAQRRFDAGRGKARLQRSVPGRAASVYQARA